MNLTLMFKALSDETRQQIVWMLSEREMSAGEIASMFKIAAPSVSHHLSVLRGAEVVIPRREGQRVIYSLNSALIEECLADFRARLRKP